MLERTNRLHPDNPPLRPEDVAMCPPCYRGWQGALYDQVEAEREADAALYAELVAFEASVQDEGVREAARATFLAQVHDRGRFEEIFAARRRAAEPPRAGYRGRGR